MNKKNKKNVTPTEFDQHRAEQEAKKAAELKAKLEMVRFERRPNGACYRKIGAMVCDTGVKSGFRNVTVAFVLRLNQHAGEFIAEHGDTWYVSKSRDALEAKMNEVARVTLDLKWTRYLHVSYEATAPSRSGWHRGTTTLEIDERRGTVVHGISLTWNVVEYSDAIQLPGRGARFMTRKVEDDGSPSDEQESVDRLPTGLVPHTKEREAVLLRLRAAIAAVDARMVELFRGSPGHVELMLDSVRSDGALLLEAPAKPKKKTS
jgi:hypothetical protein